MDVLIIIMDVLIILLFLIILAEVQGLADDIVGLHQSRAEYFFLNGNTDDAIKHLQYAVKMAGDNFSLKSKLQQKLTNMKNYPQKIRNS